MAKIDTSGWKEFKIGKLFEIRRPVARSQAKYEDGNIPFVASGNFNNGVTKWCKPKDDEVLDAGNCITVSPIDGSAFYQAKLFLGRGGAGSAILMLHNAGLTELSGLFVSSVIRQSLTKYTYSDQLNSKTIEDEMIRLPVDTSGEPDWAYMDEYMSAVMKEAEASLERLKQTDGEKHAVDASGWKEFKLTDIFRMNNTKSIVQKDVVPDSGTIPYVTAQAWNNGVMTYIDCPAEWLDEGDCIMIGGKTLTFSYQAQAFCSNDSHNIALHLKDAEKASEMHYLFLIAALRGSLYQKYSWGDSISMKTIKNDVFQLPVDASGEPDWAYMDEYMRTIMKSAASDLSAMQSIGE